jgi:hypothetical protein
MTAPQRKVTITIADDHLAQTGTIAEQLRATGMNVEQVLEAVGMVTGWVAAEQQPSIEALAGVAAVEEETTFQLAPPDSEVQ